jgi:hypothetical protein
MFEQGFVEIPLARSAASRKTSTHVPVERCPDQATFDAMIAEIFENVEG